MKAQLAWLLQTDSKEEGSTVRDEGGKGRKEREEEILLRLLRAMTLKMKSSCIMHAASLQHCLQRPFIYHFCFCVGGKISRWRPFRPQNLFRGCLFNCSSAIISFTEEAFNWQSRASAQSVSFQEKIQTFLTSRMHVSTNRVHQQLSSVLNRAINIIWSNPPSSTRRAR